MKRRTLLKTALAFPMVQTLAPTTATACTTEHRPSPTNAVFSGLPGLDYALGGMGAGEMLCVVGPPSAGKTLILLDLADRVCERYDRNVVFWSAHQPSVYLVRKKMAIKGDARIAFTEDVCFVDERDRNDQPRVIVVSSSAGSGRAYGIAETLIADHPLGCAALIMDGWSTNPQRTVDVEVRDGIVAFAAERWPHTPVTVTDLHLTKQFAQNRRMPVVIGVTTASLVDDHAVAGSFHLETQMRLTADRLVTLHRPELYVETTYAIAADKNVVCLSGTSPRWWDTRCSRLRFDPRRLGFSSVV